MFMTIYIIIVAVAFAVAVTLGSMMLPKILLISYKKRLFDMPIKRKVHDVPVPRLGAFVLPRGAGRGMPVDRVVLLYRLAARGVSA